MFISRVARSMLKSGSNFYVDGAEGARMTEIRKDKKVSATLGYSRIILGIAI